MILLSLGLRRLLTGRLYTRVDYSVIKHIYRQRFSCLQKDQGRIRLIHQTLGLTIVGKAFNLGFWNTPKTDHLDLHWRLDILHLLVDHPLQTPWVIKVGGRRESSQYLQHPAFAKLSAGRLSGDLSKREGFGRGDWSLVSRTSDKSSSKRYNTWWEILSLWGTGRDINTGSASEVEISCFIFHLWRIKGVSSFYLRIRSAISSA